MSRPVFAVDGRTFVWADVIAAARLEGSWRELEESTCRGLSCQKRSVFGGEQLPAEVISEATRRFRYAKDLLAGDELTAWLERWELTAGEWRECMVRMLLRERWVGELADTGTRFPPGSHEVAGALWAEAVCSDFLARAADRLAGDAALAAAAGEPIGAWERGSNLLGRIRAAGAHARREAVAEEAIAREVALHRLEWLRIDGEILTVPSDDAAREAALCVRTDGRSLADMGAACGVAAIRLTTFLGDMDAALSPALIAAREGELIGPIALDGGCTLLLVEHKTPPSTADANVRQRAVERIRERAVQRAMLEHVEWHEHR